MPKLKDNFFNLDKFKDELVSSITKEYIKGGMTVSKDNSKRPIAPKKKDIRLMGQSAFDNIKGVTEELSKRIRNTVRDGLLKSESNLDISKRIDNILKGDNPTRFKYEDRLKMISRTEGARALNAGSLNTAKKVGAKLKYIDIVSDSRTSAISKAMKRKYGTPAKAIPLNEEFSVMVGGKQYSGLYPPFMPNDRDMVLYVFEKSL